MDFGITIEIDSKADIKSSTIQFFSDELSSYLKEKNFGSDINSVLVGLICVKTVSGYEDWYKARKRRFQKQSKLLTFDIKIDGQKYDSFVSGSKQECLQFLATELLNSLTNFDALPKYIKDFDSVAFKKQVTEFTTLNYGV
ncbi:MAG: hypothetical protein ACI9LM_001689 [Alteromonadaceae bacterium]|jgi:hypothetical protein